MTTNPTKSLAVLLALVASLAFGACGDGDDETTASGPAAAATSEEEPAKSAGKAPATPTIVVRDGEPAGGVRELEYDAGERIRFRVRSNVADEVHVHGYDLSEDVNAGGAASFSFPAEIEGIFEVELEERGTEIAELRVNP